MQPVIMGPSNVNDYTILDRNGQFVSNSRRSNFEAKMEKFSQKVDKIKSNVRPEACLLTAAAIILSVVKGKKIADIGVKGAMIAKSFVHAGLKKAGANILAIAKNITKKGFDKQEYLNGVKVATDEILDKGLKSANNVGVADQKFVDNVKKYVKVFFKNDTEKADHISNFITDKMGINSKAGLATGAIAGVFGWKAGDGSGDALENMLDNKEIKKVHDEIFNDQTIY